MRYRNCKLSISVQNQSVEQDVFNSLFQLVILQTDVIVKPDLIRIKTVGARLENIPHVQFQLLMTATLICGYRSFQAYFSSYPAPSNFISTVTNQHRSYMKQAEKSKLHLPKSSVSLQGEK